MCGNETTCSPSFCFTGSVYSQGAYYGQSTYYAQSAYAVSPKGVLDSATCEVAKGWACDANNYAKDLTIRLYKDAPAGSNGSVGLGTTLANITREVAVGKECGGDRKHGFSFDLPESIKDGKTHKIYAYAVDNNGAAANKLLGGSPKTTNVCIPPYAQSTYYAQSSYAPAYGQSSYAVLYAQSAYAAYAQSSYAALYAQSSYVSYAQSVYFTGIDINADPDYIRQGEDSTISWSGGSATSCTVSGPQLASNLILGSQLVTDIFNQSVYTLTCMFGLQVYSASTTVKVVPVIEET